MSADADMENLSLDSACIKVHESANGGGKTADKAVGRTRGGLNTKLHAIVDFQVLPIACGQDLGPVLSDAQFIALISVFIGGFLNSFIVPSTCANAGLLTGYPDGTFKPNQSITRAEFAAVAARFLSDEYTGENVGDFSDTKGHWAAKEIRRAAEAGWVTGSNNGFRPNDKINRAEVMTIRHIGIRLCCYGATVSTVSADSVGSVDSSASSALPVLAFAHAASRFFQSLAGRTSVQCSRIPDAEHMLGTMKKWKDNPEDAWYYEAVQEATNEHAYERDELGVKGAIGIAGQQACVGASRNGVVEPASSGHIAEIIGSCPIGVAVILRHETEEDGRNLRAGDVVERTNRVVIITNDVREVIYAVQADRAGQGHFLIVDGNGTIGLHLP